MCLEETRATTPLNYMLGKPKRGPVSEWMIKSETGASGGIFIGVNNHKFSILELWGGQFS